MELSNIVFSIEFLLDAVHFRKNLYIRNSIITIHYERMSPAFFLEPTFLNNSNFSGFVCTFYPLPNNKTVISWAKLFLMLSIFLLGMLYIFESNKIINEPWYPDYFDNWISLNIIFDKTKLYKRLPIYRLHEINIVL